MLIPKYLKTTCAITVCQFDSDMFQRIENFKLLPHMQHSDSR